MCVVMAMMNYRGKLLMEEKGGVCWVRRGSG